MGTNTLVHVHVHCRGAILPCQTAIQQSPGKDYMNIVPIIYTHVQHITKYKLTSSNNTQENMCIM